MNRDVIITIILLLALGGIGFWMFSASDDSDPNTNQPQATSTQPSATSTQGTSTDSQSSERSISAQYQFNPDQSRHIVAGSIDLPTPCHTLSYETENPGTSTTATINFTATEEDTDQMCAQVMTPKRFKVTLEGGSDLQIEATYNGNQANLELTSVSKGEDLENFEVNPAE